MPNKKKFPSYIYNEGKISKVSYLLILLLVIIVLAFVSAYAWKILKNSKSFSPMKSAQQFTFVATVEDVGADYLRLVVSQKTNPLLNKDRIIQLQISKDTKIFGIPNQPFELQVSKNNDGSALVNFYEKKTPEAERGQLITKDLLSQRDIYPGIQILVVSKDDIYGGDYLGADSLYIIKK